MSQILQYHLNTNIQIHRFERKVFWGLGTSKRNLIMVSGLVLPMLTTVLPYQLWGKFAKTRTLRFFKYKNPTILLKNKKKTFLHNLRGFIIKDNNTIFLGLFTTNNVSSCPVLFSFCAHMYVQIYFAG